MVSLFYHRIKNRANTPTLNRLYQRQFGENLSGSKIREQLSGFIQVEFENNVPGARLKWNRHVLAWLDLAGSKDSRRRCCVRYEDALRAPAATIAGIIERLFALEISSEKMQLVTALHDKIYAHERLETPTDSTFVRKAIAGEWREVFSPRSGQILSGYIGDSLMRMGYETNESWWTELLP
jgi:hypothetical protein